MKRQQFVLVIIIVIFACFLLFASSTLFAQTPAGASLLTNATFQKDCAKCHGKTAEGRHFGGPSLGSDKVSAMSDDDLRTIITNGKGRMPKYAGKLTPEEISTLVEQIKELNRNKK
ncbi:MAG TPA: cytochrome c [Candidatus Sulfotelmatobacter sp.]|jgi:mono/diheme cytochrome c family protein|nr:cytochrome c [Candidatus Sulfotelmatobacter sp.]